jgi:hypothetical protein
MIKRTLLAALVAAFALVALPALALANPTLDPKGTGSFPTTFTSQGGQTFFETVGGTKVVCEKVTNAGEFTTGQTGSIRFHFTGCHDGTFGIPCNTSGRGEGEITTTTLPFHLKTVEHEGVKSDAVLITPSGEKFGTGHFAEFDCSFLVHIDVTGNGIIGTITEPATNTESKEATVVFSAASTGVQTHREVTDNPGVEYDLKAVINSNPEEKETAAQVGSGTLTFPDKALLT